MGKPMHKEQRVQSASGGGLWSRALAAPVGTIGEAWTELLLAEAAHVLGAERLEVVERWQGIYATSAKQDILRATPAPGIDVVSLTTGVGMTVGLGLGARTIASWQ